jgi:hypothetical protein
MTFVKRPEDILAHKTKSGPTEEELARKKKLEELVKQNEDLYYSWKFFLKPGTQISYLRNEKRIAELDPQRRQPQASNLRYALAMEALKICLYLGPTISLGIAAYQTITGKSILY